MKNTAHLVDRTANWCSHGGWFILAPHMEYYVVSCFWQVEIFLFVILPS
jgi:hypothetical protein